MDKNAFETITKQAKTYLDEDYHCSEGILLAVGPHYLGEVDPLALRMTTPFAGGIAGTHEELCGALAGGVMLIGALYGRTDAHTNDDFCMDLVKDFRAAFRKEFGYTCCQDLKDNWVGKPGQENCALLVEKAAGILIDILEKAESQG